MADSSIEWCDKVWNCIRGCSLVSAGCKNCYAMRQAHRFHGKGQPYEGLTQIVNGHPVWTGKVVCDESKLDEPLHCLEPLINAAVNYYLVWENGDHEHEVFALLGLAIAALEAGR